MIQCSHLEYRDSGRPRRGLNDHAVLAAEDRVDLGRRRQRRLRTEARDRERAGGAGTSERLLLVAAFEQRDERGMP